MKFNIFKGAGNLLGLGAVLIGPIGCSDFLSEEDPSNLTPESFYTIPDHAEAALASIYAETRLIGGGAGIFSSTWLLLDAIAGTSPPETAQQSAPNSRSALIYPGRTAHMVNWWNGR